MTGLAAFTLFHVVLSIIAMAAGAAAVYGLIGNRVYSRLFAVYMVTIAATDITGFLFPFKGVTPAIVVGAVSSLAVIATFIAWKRYEHSAAWRWIFTGGLAFTLYLDWFVFVVQAFLKIPALHALAPNGTEPAFGAAQGAVLLAFLAAGFLALKRFRPAA
jgi:hypothetical protein